MIKFEEFKRFDLRIGEVSEAGENIKINCRDGEFKLKFKINAQSGEKIFVIFKEDKLIIPLLNESVPIVPDKDIDIGTRVS